VPIERGVMATIGAVAFIAFFYLALPVGVLLWRDSRRDQPESPADVATDPPRAVESQPASRARKRAATAKTTNQMIQAVRIAKVDCDVAFLMDSLTDPDVRGFAARYLADIGAEEAIPSIARLLSASDARVRSSAVKALGKLRAKELAPRVMEMVKRDESSVVRSHAVGALGRIGGDRRVQGVLIDALSDPEPAVGWCAAHELGSVGDTDAIEPLLAAATRAHPLRRGTYRKAVRRIRARNSRSRF